MLSTLGNNKTPNFSFVFSFFSPPPVATNEARCAEPAEARYEAPAAPAEQERRDAIGEEVLASLPLPNHRCPSLLPSPAPS